MDQKIRRALKVLARSGRFAAMVQAGELAPEADTSGLTACQRARWVTVVARATSTLSMRLPSRSTTSKRQP